MAKLQYPEQTILRVAKATLTSAFENASELSKFGWTEQRILQFKKTVNDADLLSDENYHKRKLAGLSVEKNEVLNDCYSWAQDLKLRVHQVFDAKSAERGAFLSRQIYRAKLSEKKMMPLMENLIAYAKTNKEKLLIAGLTQDVISRGENLLALLSQKDEQQEDKKESKQSETAHRHLVFDQIYKTVNKIHSAGRRVFSKIPEKKVLFESKWPKRKRKPKPKKGQPPPDWVI